SAAPATRPRRRRPSRTGAPRCSTRSRARRPGPCAAADGRPGALVFESPMDAAAFRSEFPVLERVAYLNAGTDGPLPAAAVRAAQAELEAELRDGRATPHFKRRFELQDQLRAGYARVMGCEPADVALTTSTSEGVGAVMAGMDLGPGDEIVSSDQEHPGVLGPLKAARDRGATVRLVPFQELANAVTPSTTLVAC